MPKSKRARLVALTKTVSKGKDQKKELMEKVRDACDLYTYIYIIEPHNMRNASLKDVRSHWKSSRFFFGKNKVMQLALGKTVSEEHKESVSKLSPLISGNCGLLFTNSRPEEVAEYFDNYKVPNFARSGFVATKDFVLPAGHLEQVHFSQEPMVRTDLGLATSLKNGKVILSTETVVCKEGDVLTPEQCKLLELFGKQMAVFHFTIRAYYHSGQVFESSRDDDSDDAEDEDEEGEQVEM